MATPKLRFKGFLDPWQLVKIGDTLKIKNGKSQKEVETPGGKYPILATGGVIGRTNQYLYDQESVLIGRKGTINKPSYMNTPFWTVDTLFYSVVKVGYDPRFMYNVFQKVNWLKYNTSTGLPSLTAGNIESIPVKVPETKTEQVKIGDYMAIVDKLIKIQGDKIDALKQVKKGYLQRMFKKLSESKQRLRFKGFTDDWQRVKLDEIATFSSGGTPSVSNRQYYNGSIPFIRSSEIGSDKTALHINRDGLDSSSAKLIDRNTILYALYGATSGQVAISKIKGAINQAVLAIDVKDDFDKQFLYQLLKFNKDKIVDKFIQGGQGNLSAGIIKGLSFEFPSLAEQKKIGAFMASADNSIELQEDKLERLKELKKGYLQHLFA